MSIINRSGPNIRAAQNCGLLWTLIMSATTSIILLNCCLHRTAAASSSPAAAAATTTTTTTTSSANASNSQQAAPDHQVRAFVSSSSSSSSKSHPVDSAFESIRLAPVWSSSSSSSSSSQPALASAAAAAFGKRRTQSSAEKTTTDLVALIDLNERHQAAVPASASNWNGSMGKAPIQPRSARSNRWTTTELDAPNETPPPPPPPPLAPHSNQLELSESKHVEQMSDCALVLKRTYIVKSEPATGAASTLDEWGEKFVFNDVDPDEVSTSGGKRQQSVYRSDLCIKHSDVDRAIEEAKHKVKLEKLNDLDSLELSDLSIADVAELNLAAGRILTKKFDLSHDEILNALPMIDMSASKFYWKHLCPKHVRPMACTRSRYRTITAHCNNLKHPSWGAAKTPYSRYLPPDYADGLSAPRASRDGQQLPSARLISSIVHRDADEPSNDYSALFASWGQLLNHDITRIAVGNASDCCPHYLKGVCMPIPVPQGDPLYSKFNVKCLKFDRALAAIRPKCLLGLRAQINTITSPVDASFVYGSTRSHATRLRAFSDGRLRVWNYFERLGLKPLLPAKTDQPDQDCVGRPAGLYCFDAGDVRVNEQTHLVVLHTLYVREHNRIARQLAKLNIEWDDDRIYQEARHIVAACVQHVMVNEFLPLVLGQRHMNEYQLGPAPDGGHWPGGYDPSVTTSTGTGFATAAFRYGHSMVEGSIKRFDGQGKLIGSQLLRHLFKRPFLVFEPGVMDQLIMGMLLAPAEQTDPFMSEELSGHLFQPPKAKFGHDLAAINIQRGRDAGVPGYNDWREWCGMKRARSFSDLEPLLMNRTAHQFARIYKHVDDIDLWSAGISERKLAGAAVGPTMACIIARQFMNMKRGDRFWYENPNQPSSFTAQQLREIKRVTLAKILCTNGDDIGWIQQWAMRLPHPIYNKKVPCSSLPSLNLKLWNSGEPDAF